MHIVTRQRFLLQELQAQLDRSHKSEEAALPQLQTQLTNHQAVSDQLSKVQAEKDSALQAAANLEDLHRNVALVSVHPYTLLFCTTQMAMTN